MSCLLLRQQQNDMDTICFFCHLLCDEVTMQNDAIGFDGI